ncbi:MAG TPA: hypothetical protein VGE08_04020 [Steroidobacter sp.]|uniref:HNH endonuclease n=1 Tax=Steroidobacter sp. TaxID=1978227 RepID=UPI002ED8E301
MSMTKRMMESGGGGARRDGDEERMAAIASFFERTRPYHHAFLKSMQRRKASSIYAMLFPYMKPSQSTFAKHRKEAGSMSAYLTHYFFGNVKSVLERLGLPPAEVDDVWSKATCNYVLNLHEASRFTPSDAEIERTSSIQPKARSFRHHSRALPSIMHDKAIHEFFTGIYRKNEVFYKANPDALFRADLLDYEDYLQSPFWFLIRNVVLFRDGFKCRVCAAKASAVHHISYEPGVLYGMNLEPLVSICDPCHELIEFDENGVKITDLDVKRQRYETLARKAGSSQSGNRRDP